jgi:hypothetical protein
MNDGEEIDEDVIVSKILAFEEFSRFYHTEREPIKANVPIKWMINPSCRGFAAQRTDANGITYIELRRLPRTQDDAFLAAHEIVHVIMQKIGGKYLNFTKVDNAMFSPTQF